MSADAAPAKAQDDGPKVFVGNLPFSTTDEELKDLFKAHAATSATVIYRGQRSLGYGFVGFATDAEAAAAAAALDKSEVGGREINVEIAKAKPHDESAPRAPRGRGTFRSRGAPASARPVNGTGVDTASPAEGGTADGFVAARGRGRGGFRGRGRGRGAAQGVTGEVATVAPPAPAAEAHVGGEAAPRGRGRGRGAPRGAGAPRGGRPAGEQPAGELSKTTVFVANLPFRFEDADLAALFSGYAVRKATVVKMRSGRSKGFGFVEVSGEAEQKKILAECTALQADGRDLAVKAAMASQMHEGGEAEAAAQ